MDGATAVILVAHGSRAPGIVEAQQELCDAVATRLGSSVSAGFLEICAPDIPTAIAREAARGARRILLVPYFLHAGNHTTRDIPAIMEQARADHPGVEVELAAPLGPDPRLVEICVERVHAAWGGALDLRTQGLSGTADSRS